MMRSIGAERTRTAVGFRSEKPLHNGRKSPYRWHHGKLLFASIVILAAVPLFSLELGRYALGVLGLISVLACLPVHRQSKNWVVAPKRDGVKTGGER